MNQVSKLMDTLTKLLNGQVSIFNTKIHYLDDQLIVIIPLNKMTNTDQLLSDLNEVKLPLLTNYKMNDDELVLRLDKNYLVETAPKSIESSITKNSKDHVITIDMSSPNIAKPMTFQHLRSTFIGNTLAKAFSRKGFETYKINHLGDWGMPVSSIITAYLKWGDKEKIESNPIIELDNLYQKYLDELMINPYLEEETLVTLKKLSFGDQKIIDIWQWLKDLSMEHFNAIYDKLGITFDSVKGESYYDRFNKELIEEIDRQGKLMKAHGSLYMETSDTDILIQDSDNHSTYLSRDLAAAIYRYKHYHFTKALYVIGREQNEHFDRLKNVLNELGYEWSQSIEHVDYSLVNVENNKNEIPAIQDVRIASLIKKAETYIAKHYEVDADSASAIAVNSLIYHCLDTNRDEILTINVNQIPSILDNDAIKAFKLYHRLQSFNLNDQNSFNEITEKYDEYDDFITLLWTILCYDRVLSDFINSYESIHLTHYLSELLEKANHFIDSKSLLEKSILSDDESFLLHYTFTILDELFNVLGFQTPNNLEWMELA